jgi:hypothetical protein
VRIQAAEVVGKLGRQHRRNPAGYVDGQSAIGGAVVERRPGSDEVGHVGDVHPDPNAVALPPRRDRVVEVLRGRGIDRERDEIAQVDPPFHGRLRRVVGLEAAAETLVLEQCLQHVLDRTGLAERALEPRAAAPRRDDREVPLPHVAEPLPVEHNRDTGREHGLADDELPASGDLDDDSVGAQTWRNLRIVSPEPAAPSTNPIPSRMRAFRENGSGCTSELEAT